MPDSRRARRMLKIAILTAGCLPGVSCTQELRDGALGGASSYVGDVTYGVLSTFIPLPVRSSGTGGGDDDPFNDVPLQM